MKKKFLTFVLTLCLIIPAMLGLTACGKTDNNESNNSQNNETAEVESRKEEAYRLFTTALNTMDKVSKYKVKYEYDVESGLNSDSVGRVEYESYNRTMIFYDYNEDNGYYPSYLSNYWMLRVECKQEDGLNKLSIYPQANGSAPTNYYILYYDLASTVDSPLGNYTFSNNSYSNDMNQGGEEINRSFSFIQLIKDFDDSDIFDFEFNESGDFKIAFNYTDQNEEYIYEYSVTNEGEIESCIVYEKDVLNNKRGEEDCKITFTPNDSDTIPLTDALDAIISTYFDVDPNYFDNDRDLFGYHTESN